MDDSNSQSALEQFRQQWREEVNARSKRSSGKAGQSTTQPSEAVRSDRAIHPPPTRHPAAEAKEDHHGDDSEVEGKRPTMIERIEGLSVRGVDEDDFSARSSIVEPKSALEHYERAVEKESQGNLGDSLSHYRKAYRMDAKVDQTYKNKHFPAKSKPTNPNPLNVAPTVPSTAHHSSKEPTENLTIKELVERFASLPITGAAPIIEGDIPPPCPIKHLPYEVLLELLRHTAIIDPASFMRLSLVCKKLAYYVFTEDSVWKRVALGREFGLASQVYDFATDLQGRDSITRPLETQFSLPKFVSSFSPVEDWREVFHSYPRIRFTGVYISTVNYTRPGGGATQATWNTPVHIVTYYRYLRFFRDGTVISLLTTSEPIDVVHHLTPENIALVRSTSKDASHPLNFASSAPALAVAPKDPAASGSSTSTSTTTAPSAQHLMKHALRGRWRMCLPTPSSQSIADIATNGAGMVGDVHIETEGRALGICTRCTWRCGRVRARRMGYGTTSCSGRGSGAITR